MNNKEFDNQNIQPTDSGHYIKTTKTNNARKRVKFNFIDAILIFIIISIVFVLASYFLPGISNRLAGNEEVTIEYVIEFQCVDNEFVTNIKPNDVVYDASQNYNIGTVKTVENDNYNTLVYDENTGVAEFKQHFDFKNITVTIMSTAIYVEDEGYVINGQRIAVGKQFNLRFPEFSGSGYCVDMKISRTR